MAVGRAFSGVGISAALVGVLTGAPVQVFHDRCLCETEGETRRLETQTLLQSPVRLWKIEIEDRDDPLCVTAEFDMDRPEATAVFTTAKGAVRTERGARADGKFVFHLPDNPLFGAAEGEAEVMPDTVTGVLVTAKGRRKFHGRPQRPADRVVRGAPASASQGPGFRGLTLEVGGKVWTLSERMRFHHVPAVSLARIENYRVVEVGAFGVTDVESGTPVDTETLFQTGGMGAPMVNLLALKLAAQGRLDLDREVNRSLKSARIADNAFTVTRKTTVRDLMNGASGLSQYKFGGYRPGAPIPTLSALLAGADPQEMAPLLPEREPGTYGGEGVCGAVLQQVIEDATGKALPELMQTNLFAPLGMRHSTYALAPNADPRRKVALGHYTTGEVALDGFHLYPETGETGLWTTAGDFARMLCQVQLLLAGKPNRILSAQQSDLLKPFLTQRWILGFIRAEKDDFLPVGYLYHGGASYGYYANHGTHLSNGSGMVVMENRNLSWALNNEILKAVLKSHPGVSGSGGSASPAQSGAR